MDDLPAGWSAKGYHHDIETCPDLHHGDRGAAAGGAQHGPGGLCTGQIIPIIAYCCVLNSSVVECLHYSAVKCSVM